jgi:hypothetical protein
MGQFIFRGGLPMERRVCRGEKKNGVGTNVIFQFVDLTKVANAEKHAFYNTVTLFPIFLVRNLQNSKKIYTTKKLLFTMSSCGYCC